MKKESKSDAVASMRRMIDGQKGVVVTEHRGLTVAEVTVLRKKVREAGAEFRVVKNTLIRLAARETGFEALNEHFAGPTAVGFAKSDPVALARALKEFAATNPKVRIKAGFLDGRVLAPREVEALADLPSREVLLARLAGALASPLSNLVRAMSGPAKQLVYALHSVQEQKSHEASA